MKEVLLYVFIGYVALSFIAFPVLTYLVKLLEIDIKFFNKITLPLGIGFFIGLLTFLSIGTGEALSGWFPGKFELFHSYFVFFLMALSAVITGSMLEVFKKNKK